MKTFEVNESLNESMNKYTAPVKKKKGNPTNRPRCDWSTGAEWGSKGVTVTTASATRAACMGPASSPGSATVRRAGGGCSVTKVRGGVQ